jgi:hypothetical protein
MHLQTLNFDVYQNSNYLKHRIFTKLGACDSDRGLVGDGGVEPIGTWGEGGARGCCIRGDEGAKLGCDEGDCGVGYSAAAGQGPRGTSGTLFDCAWATSPASSESYRATSLANQTMGAFSIANRLLVFIISSW